MHTASYEFLTKPEESAESHKTHALLAGGVWQRDYSPEDVGHKKLNLGAGQENLAGSFVMTHRS